MLGDEEAHTVLAVADDASPRSGRDDHVAIERHAKIIRTRIGSHVPPARRGEHILSRADKRNIREALRLRPAEQREPASLSIDHVTRSATFAGKPFDLRWDPALAAADARLMVEYFDGFDHFSGTPEQISDLKAQYFTLWAWLYFAPFVCELRNRPPFATATSSATSESPSSTQGQLRQEQPHRHPAALHVPPPTHSGRASRRPTSRPPHCWRSPTRRSAAPSSSTT